MLQSSSTAKAILLRHMRTDNKQGNISSQLHVGYGGICCVHYQHTAVQDSVLVVLHCSVLVVHTAESYTRYHNPHAAQDDQDIVPT